MESYLIFRRNGFHFNRRVPKELKDYDPRKVVRFSLKTDSKKQALRMATLKNVELESYWQKLIETGKKHVHEYYVQVVKRSSIFGFQYKPVEVIATGPIEDIIDRLNFVDQPKISEKQAEAVLGGARKPIVMLEDVLPKFWNLSNDVRLTKTPLQYRKWQNTRKRAMRNFIDRVGNKVVTELTRDDFLDFRDWWIERIDREELKNSGARSDFKRLRTILGVISDHYKLGLELTHLFSRLLLPDDSESRPPFTTEFILNTLLCPEKLKGMGDENQKMLMVLAELGVGIDEQAGILPEDIYLDQEIPYIDIQPRRRNKLKTKYRRRILPLVGFALDAFKAYPKGFSEYATNPDSISSAIGKYLRENNLLPTEKHSAYSLRHSFQDRLTKEKCGDRIQVDLMGHKFDRELYGVGAPLQEKFDELKKIQLKPRQ